jgi:L-alanine-DL-glutamate epimerase-like enolase superfamily enzyme
MAADRGRLVVPHCWKTGIGIAASAHLCFANAHCPYIEFLPSALSESALRRDLVREELELVDGQIALPHKPGLGIELNMDAMERFRADRVVTEFAD